MDAQKRRVQHLLSALAEGDNRRPLDTALLRQKYAIRVRSPLCMMYSRCHPQHLLLSHKLAEMSIDWWPIPLCPPC